MDVLRTKLSQHRILLYDVDIVRSVKVEYSNYIQTIARKPHGLIHYFYPRNWTRGLEVSYIVPYFKN